MEPTEETGDRAQGPEQVLGAGSDSEPRSRGAASCSRGLSLHWAGGDTSSASARTGEAGSRAASCQEMASWGSSWQQVSTLCSPVRWLSMLWGSSMGLLATSSPNSDSS